MPTNKEMEAAAQVQVAAETAKPFLQEALDSFCKHMTEKKVGYVAYGLVGYKFALFEAAVELQLIMEYGGVTEPQPEKIAEMMFAESARVAFRKIVAEHGGLAEMKRHIKKAKAAMRRE